MTNASAFNYQVGGSLPADAPSYVERQCDRDYYELLKERKYCYVFNCRQMGKSSLRVRVTHKLQAEGIVCATIDPQKIGVEVTCEQWYASAIRSLVGDLDLKSKFDLRSWIRERELLSPVQRFAEFIETVVLQEIDAPIVIFVEEIDRLLSLKFGMDDFFGLVRSLFEDRPTKLDYNRLTFSFLGVATPTDLIQSHNTSAFNIGYAVEMAGFTLTEALPLMQGLASKVANPQDYLKEAVKWTGGQPFLIQRLLGMMEKELAGIATPENIAVWVENLVQERIVTNWESQDAPPHLTTIRDRVLSVEEKLRGRMLGCYQQVLADGELEDDRSEERSKLRLTGLVVRREGKLRSYNPIYGAVFSNAWVERQLADLRPEFYGSAFRAWQEAEQKDGFLLRGEALQKSDEWARGKRLSDADEQFLHESREVEKIESRLRLDTEKQQRENAEKAQEIECQKREVIEEVNRLLVTAERTARQRVRIGSFILVGTLVLTGIAGTGSWIFILNAKKSLQQLDRRVGLEVANRAEGLILNYFESTSQNLNDLNSEFLRLKLISQNDLALIEKYFLAELKIYKDIATIFFGTEDGAMVGVDKANDNQFFSLYMNAETAPNRLTYQLDLDGNQGQLVKTYINYDPRKRPWYFAAKQSGRSTWTSIFVSTSTGQLTTTAAKPSYDKSGKLIGVFGINLSLEILSDFVKNISIHNNGQIFVMGLDGAMIASSAEETLFFLDGNSMKRLDVTQSKHQLIRESGIFLKKNFPAFVNINQTQELDFNTSDGKLKHIVVKPIRKNELNWIIVVVVPES
jgi:AAA-like domain/Cache domain